MHVSLATSVAFEQKQPRVHGDFRFDLFFSFSFVLVFIIFRFSFSFPVIS